MGKFGLISAKGEKHTQFEKWGNTYIIPLLRNRGLWLKKIINGNYLNVAILQYII